MSPPKRHRFPGSPEEWLEFAESDLRLARIAAANDVIRPEQACFHAQQAAEKAVKAVLRSRGVEFPLTHDLDLLLQLAGAAGFRLPGEIQHAGILTPYAVETRYPGCQAEISSSEVGEAIETAQAVLTWAQMEVSRHGGSAG